MAVACKNGANGWAEQAVACPQKQLPFVQGRQAEQKCVCECAMGDKETAAAGTDETSTVASATKGPAEEQDMVVPLDQLKATEEALVT